MSPKAHARLPPRRSPLVHKEPERGRLRFWTKVRSLVPKTAAAGAASVAASLAELWLLAFERKLSPRPILLGSATMAPWGNVRCALNGLETQTITPARPGPTPGFGAEPWWPRADDTDEVKAGHRRRGGGRPEAVGRPGG